MSRATVDRFVAWHRGVRMIEWTGIEKNANKMAFCEAGAESMARYHNQKTSPPIFYFDVQ